MKITYNPNKEDIQNLPQLDRIEYKLDKDNINNSYSSFTNEYLWKFALPICLTFMLVYWFGSGEHYITALMFLIKLIRISLWIIGIGILVDVIIIFINRDRLNKLNQRYFERRGKWQTKKKKVIM